MASFCVQVGNCSLGLKCWSVDVLVPVDEYWDVCFFHSLSPIFIQHVPSDDSHWIMARWRIQSEHLPFFSIWFLKFLAFYILLVVHGSCFCDGFIGACDVVHRLRIKAMDILNDSTLM